MFVSQRGFEIPRELEQECALARAKLTFQLPEPSREVVVAYKETNDHVIIPHFFGIRTYGRQRDVRMDHERLSQGSLAFAGSLRASQQTPVEKTIESLETHGGATLCLPTGAGKTACALYIASHLKSKTLILVHKKFLADQFKDRIAQFLPNATVTTIQGDICDTSGEIVIAMIQTLVSRRYDATVFEPFSFLIFDEAHHVAARVFSSIMFTLNLRYTLGLTATPRRRDGLEQLIFDFLGPISFQQGHLERPHSVTVYMKPFTTTYYTKPPPTNRRGDIDHVKMITMLAHDENRSLYIANVIHEMEVLRNRDILILSHRRAHCEHLASLLRSLGHAAETYLGGCKKIPTSRIVVSTYAYVSEGFDEPRFDALVMATPSSDVTQAVGRVLRRLNDPSCKPLILDFVDQWSLFFSQAAKRKAFYMKSGFRQACLAFLHD